MARKRTPFDDPNLIILDGPQVIGSLKLADGRTYSLREMNVGQVIAMGRLNKSDMTDDELLPHYIDLAAAVTGAEVEAFNTLSAKQVLRVCAMSQFGVAAVKQSEAAMAEQTVAG